ncbi:Thioesterase superfamily protein [Sphingobium faniae]|nr:Thioesterase superfamily protein [Sphingobium faniae]
MSEGAGKSLSAATDPTVVAARVALAREARALVDALATADLTLETAKQLEAAVKQARLLAEQAPSIPGYVRRIEGALRGIGPYSELGPFTGDLHIVSPALELWEEDGRVKARAAYGPSCEGAPGIVHGGYLAATLDELLAYVQRGNLRMTVALNIAYRAPARLHRDLLYTVWIERIEGRKAFVAGTVHQGDLLCAEAHGVFVETKAGMLAREHFE